MSRPRSLSAVTALKALNGSLITCSRCPRLVAWREQVAIEKRRAYRDETYWGRPVPGFGDPAARLVLVGLAPGAHGANRTGRMFTGDRSGDFLYAALFRAGVASSPESERADDGLTLRGVYITAPVRCAPPDNKPLPSELTECRTWMVDELRILQPRVYLALGRIAYDTLLGLAREHAPERKLAAPAFAHGVATTIPDPRGGPEDVTLFASYHVSQQNTQTGRLTDAMFDAVLGAALMAATG